MHLASIYHELAHGPNGRITHVQHMRPIAVRELGSLLRINQNLADSGDGTRPHMVTHAPLRVQIANDSARRLLPVPGDDSKWLEIGAPFVQIAGVWTQVSLGAPSRSANQITWTRPQTITTLTHGGHFLKAEIELRSGFVPENNFIAFPVGIQGLTRSGVTILSGGVPVAQLRPFVMTDAANANDIRPISHQFTNLNGNPYLVLTLPSLAGMSRPVIDPTLTLQPDGTAGMDCYTRENAADTNTPAVTLWGCWAGAGARRIGLMKFDLSSVPSTAVVNSAILSLWNDTQAGESFEFNSILAANSAWTEAAATWNYAVASTTRWAGDTGGDGGSDAGCSVSGTDWNATALGTLTTVAEPVGSELQITLSAAQVQAWLSANYGFVGRITTASQYNWRSSDHATAANRPQLSVVYSLPASGKMRFPSKSGHCF